MTLRLLRKFTVVEDRPIRAITFLDENRVLCGLEEPPLFVIDLETGNKELTLSARVHNTTCLAISKDGKLAMSGHGSWGGAKVWNLESGNLLHDLDESIMYVGSVGFDADGRALVAKGSMGWAFSSAGVLETEPKNDGQRASPVDLSPDGKLKCELKKKIVTLSAFPSGASARQLGDIPGDHTDFGVVAFSSDGEAVAVGDRKGNVRVWRCHDGALVRSIDGAGGSIEDLALSGARLFVLEEEDFSARLKVFEGDSIDSIEIDGSVLAVSASEARLVVGTLSGELSLIERS